MRGAGIDEAYPLRTRSLGQLRIQGRECKVFALRQFQIGGVIDGQTMTAGQGH